MRSSVLRLLQAGVQPKTKPKPILSAPALRSLGRPLCRAATATGRQAPLLVQRRGLASDGRGHDGSMGSDGDYMAFLDRANKDADEGRALGQQQQERERAGRAFKALDTSGDEVPKVIRDVCAGGAVYVSEADEPFEAVSLKYEGADLPDEGEFARLIGHWEPAAADVDIMDPLDWDAGGRYGGVVDAVRAAGRGSDVRVYRVARDGARAEYWVVTRDGGRVVGVRALSVES